MHIKKWSLLRRLKETLSQRRGSINMAMKKGQHVWPYSGKVHSESDKHKSSPKKKGVNYIKPDYKYKEGKWGFIR